MERSPKSPLKREALLMALLILWLLPARGIAQRTLNLVNNCGSTFWVGVNGSVTGNLQGGYTLAPTPAGCPSTPCPSSQTCNKQTGQCQYVIKPPANFSGRLWPMTGCSFNSSGACPDPSVNCCATGGCTTNTTGAGTWGLNCANSGQPPMTVAEMTLSPSGSDNYDVSMVDGFNVPVEITPGSGANPPAKQYWCGNPGGPASVSGLEGCPWRKILDSTCNGNPMLRVVNPAACTSNSDCVAPSTCNLGTNVCQCTSDGGCAQGQICGVGNNQIISYLACGTFAGCTTPKDLCGIGQYFNHLPGGSACTDASQCASNTCTNGTCTASPADAFNCNQLYPGTVSCQTHAQCPILTGILFASQAACACPGSTRCVQIPNSTSWTCQETCKKGQCAGQPCTSNADCITLANGTATGTFLLCDLEKGSTTFQQCVSTNTSLFNTTGVNGASCYENPDATTLCGGCPTSPANKLSKDWPSAPPCNNNNTNWASAVQPWLAGFKKACPTAYSFPFDDPTSLFQCSTGTNNTMSYTITFCPSQAAKAAPEAR